METLTSTSLGFRALLAQDKAKLLLRRAVAGHRLSHAYLFRGPAGVGKKRAALALGAYLNCLAPAAEDSCGLCPSCVKFRAASHPDLLWIEPEGQAIKIGQIRALKKQLSFPPLEAAVRLVVLTEVHTMRREAANSLLKTLEEPPPQTILLLTGDEAGHILPTILSRCQVVPFTAIPLDLLGDALARETDLAPEEAATLAAVAEGSWGRARLLLEQDLFSLRREVVETLTGLEVDQPGAVEKIFELAETCAKLKEHLPSLLALLRTWLRDLLLLQLGAPPERLVNRDLLPLLENCGRLWHSTALFAKLRQVDEAEKQLRHNCNRTAVCEVLFFHLL